MLISQITHNAQCYIAKQKMRYTLKFWKGTVCSIRHNNIPGISLIYLSLLCGSGQSWHASEAGPRSQLGTFTHAQADAGGGGRKIGFNTNHYMCSHMRGRETEAEREQDPLRKKWVQHPICRVRFETACSKPSLSSRNGRSARVHSASAPRMCEHTRGRGAGMSKSARLRSATAPRMC